MKTKGILLREVGIVFWNMKEKMTGRLTKERITKDVRYQESREVTLEWWDYNLHSRVTSFLSERRNSRRTKATLKGQIEFT